MSVMLALADCRSAPFAHAYGGVLGNGVVNSLATLLAFSGCANRRGSELRRLFHLVANGQPKKWHSFGTSYAPRPWRYNSFSNQ